MKELIKKIIKVLEEDYNLQRLENKIYYSQLEVVNMIGNYDSLEFAKNIVNIAIENGIYITHLQLQKILYYIQGSYLKILNQEAFSDEILCWEYGPVIKKVWDFFSYFGRSPLMRFSCNKIEFCDVEYDIILKVINEKTKMTVWDLVDATHQESPWKEAYENKTQYISKKKMREFFCNEQ